MADKVVNQAQVDVTRLLNIPTGIIKTELEGLYGTKVLQDMCAILPITKRLVK